MMEKLNYEQIQQIGKLDPLHIHTNYDENTNEYALKRALKYDIGQYPTSFECEKCGKKWPLEDLKYNPYENTHICKKCI